MIVKRSFVVRSVPGHQGFAVGLNYFSYYLRRFGLDRPLDNFR
jgi:hypothetical protein